MRLSINHSKLKTIMAEGSQRFALYYLFTFLLYLAITIASFSLLAPSTSTCNTVCPLTIPNDVENNQIYSDCLCNVSSTTTPGSYVVLNSQGWVPGSSSQDSAQRYNMIANTVFNSKGEMVKFCYICGPDATDDTVYQPCATYDKSGCTLPGLTGFQPATDSIKVATMCNTQTQTINANILTSPTITLRSFVTVALYAIAVFYLLMTLAALVCAIGYNTFGPKYSSDWGHLTRIEKWLGVCCKIFPIVTRVANLLVLFFLLVSVISIYSYKVCFTATNSAGQLSFYPTISGFIAFVSVAWLFTCLFGSLFQKFVPRDTSFYNPPIPLDPDADGCQKFCARVAFFFAHYGP